MANHCKFHEKNRLLHRRKDFHHDFRHWSLLPSDPRWLTIVVSLKMKKKCIFHFFLSFFIQFSYLFRQEVHRRLQAKDDPYRHQELNLFWFPRYRLQPFLAMEWRNFQGDSKAQIWNWRKKRLRRHTGLKIQTMCPILRIKLISVKKRLLCIY